MPSDEPLKIAVTGASGFIGRRLVAAALSRGWQVTAMCREPQRFHATASGDLNVVSWDIHRPETYARHFADADAICHFAAHVPQDFRSPTAARDCFAVNAVGTHRAATTAAAAGVKRFIYASTLGAGRIYAASDQPAKEDESCQPSGPAIGYLKSKLAGEELALSAAYGSEMTCALLRLASVYGPGMKGGVVPAFVNRAVSGQPLKVNDGGVYTTDLVWVDDVVEAALNACQRDIDGLFHVASGCPISMRELSQLVAENTGLPSSKVKIQPRTADASVPFRRDIDVSHSITELQTTTTPPNVGILRMISAARQRADAA